MQAPLSAARSVPISPDQRQQFFDAGFFITDVLFDEPTLAAVRAEFQRLWDAAVDSATTRNDPESLHWAKVRPFLAQLDHQSETCRAFCHHPIFADISRQLLGPNADLSWNQAIIKAPMPQPNVAATRANQFAWHQDDWYARHGDYVKDSNLELLCDPNSTVTAWVAISRTTVENGTLWVLPGRHKNGLVEHIWDTERREWQAQIDTTGQIPVVLQPGQVLMFRRFLPHSSGANVSNETRMAYQLGFSLPGIKLGPSRDISPLIRNGELV